MKKKGGGKKKKRKEKKKKNIPDCLVVPGIAGDYHSRKGGEGGGRGKEGETNDMGDGDAD